MDARLYQTLLAVHEIDMWLDMLTNAKWQGSGTIRSHCSACDFSIQCRRSQETVIVQRDYETIWHRMSQKNEVFSCSHYSFCVSCLLLNINAPTHSYYPFRVMHLSQPNNIIVSLMWNFWTITTTSQHELSPPPMGPLTKSLDLEQWYLHSAVKNKHTTLFSLPVNFLTTIKSS